MQHVPVAMRNHGDIYHMWRKERQQATRDSRSDTNWSNLLYSQLKWQWICFYWPSAQNNCNKGCSSMPTTQWELDKTKSADQINPDSNIWDCGTSLRLRHSWCLCWWQKWKLMRVVLLTSPTFPLLLDFLLAPCAKPSLLHLGDQT